MNELPKGYRMCDAPGCTAATNVGFYCREHKALEVPRVDWPSDRNGLLELGLGDVDLDSIDDGDYEPAPSAVVTGRPIAFQRPRIATSRGGKRHGWNPPRYTAYKHDAGRQLREQLGSFGDTPVEVSIVVADDVVLVSVDPVQPARVRGKLQGDIDNYAKSILDALQDTGPHKNQVPVINDDKQVRRVNVRFPLPDPEGE